MSGKFCFKHRRSVSGIFLRALRKNVESCPWTSVSPLNYEDVSPKHWGNAPLSSGQFPLDYGEVSQEYTASLPRLTRNFFRIEIEIFIEVCSELLSIYREKCLGPREVSYEFLPGSRIVRRFPSEFGIVSLKLRETLLQFSGMYLSNNG